jgi:hypothetical protein
MSVFRQTVMRQKEHHTWSTLHHPVLAVGALWDDNTKNTKQTFRLAVALAQACGCRCHGS